MRINKCKAGNSFTNALNDALKPLADQSANAPFSLLAAMIMPHLLLCRTKKADDNSANKTLSRRLDLWFSGKLTEFFHEAGALQKRKPAAKQKVSEPKPIKRFNEMMKEGKVSGAMRVLAWRKRRSPSVETQDWRQRCFEYSSFEAPTYILVERTVSCYRTTTPCLPPSSLQKNRCSIG